MNRQLKLLAVDDERQNLNILREILSFYPVYSLRVASSGYEALDMMRTFTPELVLLDIMMPGLNGYEVCRKIREDKTNKYCKIIMVSGLSMVDDRLKAYEVGADDYIAKPFVEEELIAKLGVFSKLSRMEEIDDLKTTALNILSHETRTPLNGIFLALDLLEREQGFGRSQNVSYMEVLRTSAERLKYLLEKISRYCEVKSGVSFNFRRGNVVDFFEDILERYGQLPGSIKVTTEYVGEEYIKVDWGLLYEVVFTLLDNAVKNSPLDGTICCSYTELNGLVEIAVRDQGKGVPESMQKRIFTGLYSPDIIHHSSGTGLSLAISDAIVSSMGGNISCDGKVEKGAEFKIKLMVQK